MPVASLGGVKITLAAVLLPTAYMYGPAIGTVVTRLTTGEGFSDAGLRPALTDRWRSYVLAWVGPPLLILGGAVAYFLVRPGMFDPGMSHSEGLITAQTGGSVPMALQTLVAIQLLAAFTIGPALNLPAVVGEEFGWRAYLFPKLRPHGDRVAAIGHGLIWGVWHWPVLLMGYNYGFEYPGAPIAGLLAFCVFTVASGTALAWLRVRSESVWPPALAHGAINATAGLGIYVLATESNPLLGPTPTGIL
ncbi:MAG: CPBP family intramembrane glutamic endopeptidase, partial [Halococcoides sp.]